jgi:hypothetical protein
MKQQLPPAGRRPVEWIARQIGDPVLRLRFLKTFAPRVTTPFYSRPLKWLVPRILLILLLFTLAATGVSVVLLHGKTGVFAAQAPIARKVVPLLAETTAAHQPEDIWLVEKDADSEVYSNGLRIDSRSVLATHPRSYLAFPAGVANPVPVKRFEPAGIVFHTTESLLVPFEAEQNGVLQRIGESLLDYVRRKHAYHFLIDRFGRVHRVIRETDEADHAGYSVWADDKWQYINLNESFLGVSFEAQTRPGQMDTDISPAQLRAAAMLTELLRRRYNIPAGNCITHAQVSVNPSNMRIGYHTDWASGFPFEQLGLPDNYRQPLPALWAFGFEYDPTYWSQAGERIQVGVQFAEETLQQKAEASGHTVVAYRRLLQQEYRELLRQVRHGNSSEREESE